MLSACLGANSAKAGFARRGPDLQCERLFLPVRSRRVRARPGWKRALLGRKEAMAPGRSKKYQVLEALLRLTSLVESVRVLNRVSLVTSPTRRGSDCYWRWGLATTRVTRLVTPRAHN